MSTLSPPELAWATSPVYDGRAHTVLLGQSTSWCGLPVDHVYAQRPDRPGRVCPECAVASVTWMFPATVAPLPVNQGNQGNLGNRP